MDSRGEGQSRVRVVVYSTYSFERTAWEQVLQETSITDQIEVSYISACLVESTAPLCANAKAVVLFAGDSSHDEKVLNLLRDNGVKLILLRYAGKSAVNDRAARRLGISVAQVSSTRARTAVAEYVVTLILNLHRQVMVLGSRAKSGNLVRIAPRQEVLIKRTVGLLGTDKVGCDVGRILRRIGCQVLAFDVIESQEAHDEGVKYVDMERLLKQSDIISLHVPPVTNTRHLINESTLARCKRGVHIINTGSLELIDLQALISSISSGQVGGFAADLFDGTTAPLFGGDPGLLTRNIQLAKLKSLPNVLLTAHQSSLTPEGQCEIVRTVINLLKGAMRSGVFN